MMKALSLRMMLACALLAVTLAGCGGSLLESIVSARNDQGDRAFARGNYPDASTAYRLALQLSPSDVHARSGLALVQLHLAESYYQDSKFEDALAALAVAAKYDPDSVRLAQLREQVEQARVRRQIALSNYPTYRESAIGLRRAYTQLKTLDAAIVASVQRFGYTYDSAELAKAIRQSNELSSEVTRLTARLSNFRNLVESGAPERHEEVGAPAGSLLPLP